MKRIAIIGGGAAGFFTAINLAERKPDYEITIYEASNKLLSKVLVSGGGRCNVTNKCADPVELSKNYPRGSEFLVDIFKRFNTVDTRAWFTDRKVKLKIEEDGRVFPVTDSSQTIYNCLYDTAVRNGVTIRCSHRLKQIVRNDHLWSLNFGHCKVEADTVIFCTGSSVKIWELIQDLGIHINTPVPSLFTLTTENAAFKELSGISVNNVELRVKGIPVQSGPILLTHKGLSGPSVLRLSSWGAHKLNECDYKFTVEIDWIPQVESSMLIESMTELQQSDPKARVIHFKGHGLPKRLYLLLVDQANIQEYTNWAEMGKKGIARLIASLKRTEMTVVGKNTFKEEFVTAGGVDLNEIDPSTMSSKQFPNLFFSGEVLDIDAITGGFNFQAAWSTAYIISQSV